METTESGGVAYEHTEEKVTFCADTNSADRFLPRIAVAKSRTANGRTTIEKSFRPFEAADMARVLDFKEVPDPPEDTAMRVCEDTGSDGLKFPVRNVCVRGGFLFYFDVEDIDDHVTGGYVSYHAPPLGVVPIDHCDVATPPGGRRVFREHAHTDAKHGYEFVLIHAPEGGAETTRPAVFFVAESLAQREKWLKALRMRSEVTADTKLRPNISGRRGEGDTSGQHDVGGAKGAIRRNKRTQKRRVSEDMEHAESAEARDVESAKREFGLLEFADEDWLNAFFTANNDFEAGNKIDQLEQWQASIKRGLRGAVLEQYEYFVEASSEMSTMGKEVTALKTMVETQSELIKEMKDIDFMTAFAEGDDDDALDSVGEDAMDTPNLKIGGGTRSRRRRPQVQQRSPDDMSEDSSISSDEGTGLMRSSVRSGPSGDLDGRDSGTIEIPSWLDDVNEEISAFIKECRYTDATDLLFKARDEVNEILNQHDRPTVERLTKKQQAYCLNMLNTLQELSSRMSNRLVEGLRRKNEAFKQSGKRERSDPLALMAPIVSPCCLGDDLIPLHLLVKLGQTQEAATAYAARRSLLLLECLHERPISGSGNVDLVIYAAQLSQSFFSCLAIAVEGFLDLFLVQPDVLTSGKDEDSNSMMSSASRNVPPGALASIVLWCDSELSKFSSAFGGTRILGNLALSPPPRQDLAQNKARVVGFEDEGFQSNKERKNAIDIAAQCVEQAFTYASENLDSIGLPLTPRLAEYVRSRLKGCEAEVSRLLSAKWKHVAFEWELELDEADIPMDEGRRFALQTAKSQEAA